jgi:UDP-N-acetylmuramoylalanine--D-glutamate ligase
MSFSPTLFQGRRYAVVGLGRNGTAAAAALAAMGAEVVVWDDNAQARAASGFAAHDPVLGYAGFDALVLSPGIPHQLPAPHEAARAARLAGIPILSDAELLFQAVRASGSRARFAGITGTNGKSTTTALLHHILQGAGVDSAAGGNLGVAALALPPMGDGGAYVLEMSSYMLERLTTLRFDVAALLNLSPDHIDRHGDMDGYARAKRHVFDRQAAGDTAVVGIDDADAAALAAALTAMQHGPTVVTVSGGRPAMVWGEDGALRDVHGPIMRLADAAALPGDHNAQNAAAATAMARALGVSDADIIAGITTYPGLPHRQQRVAEFDGVAWINDSKATNSDAAARAIGCYDRIIWIAGGMAKEGGIEPLRPLLPRIVHALLIGRDAPILARTLDDAGIPSTMAGTLEAAVDAAGPLAQTLAAPVVLLSPACASWDQFTGFEQRGDRFRDLVLADHRQRGAI